MENILNYAIQINVLLTVVYLGYAFLLKNLTFYMLNRVYLLTGIVFSFVYPFLDIQSWFSKPIPSVGEIAMDWSMFLDQDVEQSFFTLNNILIIILGIGIAVLFIRFLIQMISLLRIHIYSEPAQWQSYLFRNVFIPIVPFSFLNKIYVNRDHHDEPELLDIFKHEDIHVKGLHSIDILISEFTLISSWFNPLVWLMRKGIRENLEFLTDQQVLNHGVDKQAYQYSLLRVNSSGGAATLGNQFSFKALKRRIMMMNKKRSAKIQMSKYAFMLPVFVLTAAAFTLNKAEAKITEAVDAAKEMTLAPVVSEVQKPVDTIEKEIDIKPDTLKGKVIGFKLNTDTVSRGSAIVDASFKTTESNGVKTVIIRGNSSLGKDVLYIVDGKETQADDISSIDPYYIKEISVVKDQVATVKYGEKAKNGVIFITTKSSAEKFSAPTASESTSSLKNKNDGIEIKERASATVVSTTSPRITIHKRDRLANDPLYLVDGKIYEGEISSIQPDHIESIEVLKDASATALYGAKAENGVIIVTTKKETSGNSTTLKSDNGKTIKGVSIKVKNNHDSVKTIPESQMDEITIIGIKK